VYPEIAGKMNRIPRLQANLPRAGVDIAILNYSKSVFYYTGISQPACLIVTPEDYHLLIRRGMEHVPGETFLPGDRISEGGRDLADLAEFLKQPNWKGKRVGIEMDVTPASRYTRMLSLLPGCEIVDVTGTILAQRQIKDPEEVETIRSAGRMVHEGHKRILSVLCEGMTELELSAEIEDAHRKAGHEGQWFSRQFDARLGRGAMGVRRKSFPRSRKCPVRHGHGVEHGASSGRFPATHSPGGVSSSSIFLRSRTGIIPIRAGPMYWGRRPRSAGDCIGVSRP